MRSLPQIAQSPLSWTSCVQGSCILTTALHVGETRSTRGPTSEEQSLGPVAVEESRSHVFPPPADLVDR